MFFDGIEPATRMEPSQQPDIIPAELARTLAGLLVERARRSPDATAYGERGAPYLFSFDTTWSDPADSELNIGWTRRHWDELHRFSSGSLYLNFPGFGEQNDQLVQDAYGANYQRLVALKRRYDPHNLFRMNQNIDPNQG